MRNRYRGPDHEYDRQQQMRRIFQVAIAISQRGHSIIGLSEKFEVSTKTIRRDLALLEQINIPVYQANGLEDRGNSSQMYAKLYRIDRAFLAPFLNKSAVGPSAETTVAVDPRQPSGQPSNIQTVSICPNCAGQRLV